MVGGSPPPCEKQGVRSAAEWVLSALGWFLLFRTSRRMLTWVVVTYWSSGRNRERVSPRNPMGKAVHRREAQWLRVGGSGLPSTLVVCVCVFFGGRLENHTDEF
uniref:(northern house mosquito) hypothetical protein n=1 Tax=Culex pipiens TaxID=7175 RepID=A0A8D8KKE6_CULPI